MGKFVYKAMSRANKPIEGEIEAKNASEAKELLSRKGFMEIKVSRAPIQISFLQKVSLGDLARFTRLFSVMFSSGLPITSCLEILSVQTENPMLRNILKQLNNDVQTGNTIADSMRKHPKVFSQLYCYMVEAGEVGGILDDVLRRLSEYLESQDRVVRKIKGAMMYPVVIGIVAVIAVLAMLKFVVPTFAQLFASTGAELPLPTRIVMGISDFVSNYFLVIIAVMGLSAWGFIMYKKSPKGAKQLDALAMKLPIFGDLIVKGIVARFARTLGTLLHSGVNIIDALRVTGKTANNLIFEEAIEKVITKIAGGESIADPLAETGIFPHMVIQMINVGEKTGNLDGMLEKIAELYEEEVDMAVDSLTSLLEPLVIVVMGIIVGGMLIAMYLPMFDLFQHIG